MVKILKKIQITAVVLLVAAVFIAFRNGYTYNQEHIVCNPQKCVIEHIILPTREVAKTEKFDIKGIKNFEAKFDGYSYHLYANYKNGKSKRVSLVYISPRYKHFIDGPVDYLNNAIAQTPLDIDLYFPDNSYFPEYGY